MMKFWANKGIDGFRLDAFQFAAKDTTFPTFPPGYEKNFSLYYAVGPHLNDYLKEMNSEVLSKYNVMSVAEGAGNSFKDAHDMVDADRKELNMAYAFDGVDVAKQGGYSLLHFKEVFTRWDSAFATNGWLSIFLSNHDQARLVSRFGNDSPEYRDASSKMLATFMMTMRGTPYYYNGDELGMTNAGFTKIEDYRDVSALNEYKYQKSKGADMQQFLKGLAFGSRDNGRTPFQWDATPNAGFTAGTPWIGVNPNYTTINAAAQENDPNSCLSYFRKVVKLRKENLALVYGKYTLLDKDNPNIYAYTREYKGEKFLVLLNFSATIAHTAVHINNFPKRKVLIDNFNKKVVKLTEGLVELQPYEAMVAEVE